jgi:serine/threonine protein kinase
MSTDSVSRFAERDGSAIPVRDESRKGEQQSAVGAPVQVPEANTRTNSNQSSAAAIVTPPSTSPPKSAAAEPASPVPQKDANAFALKRFRNAFNGGKYTLTGWPTSTTPVFGTILSQYVSGGFQASVNGESRPELNKVVIFCLGGMSNGIACQHKYPQAKDEKETVVTLMRNWDVAEELVNLKAIARELVVLWAVRGYSMASRIRDAYLSNDGTDLYLVQDYVPRTLSQFLRHPEQFPKQVRESEVKYLAAQMLLALQAIHRLGVVGERITPNDVKFHPITMRVFLSGFAEIRTKGLTSAPRSALTTTPPDPDRVPEIPYAAPEILLESKVSVPASDVYSVACIIMELLLKRPFLHGKDTPNQLRFITEFGSGFPTEDTLKQIREKLQPSDRAMAFLTNRLKGHLEAGLKDKGKDLTSLPSMDMYDIALPPLAPEASEEEQANRTLGLEFLRGALAFNPFERAPVDRLLASKWLMNDERTRALIEENLQSHLDVPDEGILTRQLKAIDDAPDSQEVMNVLVTGDCVPAAVRMTLAAGDEERREPDSSPSMYSIAAVFPIPPKPAP